MPPKFKTEEERELYNGLKDEIVAEVKSAVADLAPPAASEDAINAVVNRRVAELKASLEAPKPPDQTAINMEYLRSVMERNPDRYNKLVEKHPDQFQRLTTAGSTNMAYAVPTGYKSNIIRLMKERVWLRDWVQVIPVSEKSGDWPVEGITRDAERVAEEAAPTTSTKTLGRVQWAAYTLARMIEVSVELMATATPDLMNLITELMAFKMADAEFKEFATGSGSNAFLGLTNSAFTLTSPETGGNPVQTMLDVLYTLTDGYDASPKCAFVMHRNAKKILHTAKTAKGDFFFNVGAPLTEFHGIPILTCSHLPSTGSMKVYVGDLSKWGLFDVGDWGMAFDGSGHDNMSKGKVGLYARKFNDGKRLLDEAFAETTLTA